MDIVIEHTGDWAKVDRLLAECGSKFRAEVKAATDRNGEHIVTTMVGHFEKQDLGWQQLTEKYAARKAAGRTKRAKRLTRKELVGRLDKLGIAHNPKEAKPVLAQRLVSGAIQILIDSGTLMQNIRYQRQGWNRGFVGILRNVKSRKKAKLVDIGLVHEFGSSDGRIPARPYVAPTAKEVEDAVIKAYEEAVEKAFR